MSANPHEGLGVEQASEQASKEAKKLRKNGERPNVPKWPETNMWWMFTDAGAPTSALQWRSKVKIDVL